jgi:periplasmic divalent cation tolerance protein
MLSREKEKPIRKEDGKVRQFILVLTATGSRDEAQTIADAAVDKQVAAAVQVLGPVTSTYRWNDKKERSEEWLCLLKTSQDLYEELESLIRGMHSYEVPGIVALPIVAGSTEYFAWYEEGLKKQETAKEHLLHAFDEAHERLINAAVAAAARGVSREGDLGPREVLAHIVGWEAEATERIPLLVAGSQALTYDDHAFNAAVLTVLGDHPFEVVCEMLRRTHQRLAQMLSTQEDTVFVPRNSVYERVKAQIHHSNEHAQKLDELV